MPPTGGRQSRDMLRRPRRNTCVANMTGCRFPSWRSFDDGYETTPFTDGPLRFEHGVVREPLKAMVLPLTFFRRAVAT